MQCDVMRPGWLRGCETKPKWWWCEDPESLRYKWHPRCGTHARLPGNTKCARIPISAPDPNTTPSAFTTEKP